METTKIYHRTTVYLSNGTVIIKDFTGMTAANEFRSEIIGSNVIKDRNLNVFVNRDHIVAIEIRAWDAESNPTRKVYLESAFWVKNPKGGMKE